MSAMQAVRVRFAPSPTGHLHVGGVRTALLNWLYARNSGGKLILRIEDTDQARSTRESERILLEDLQKLGLTYEEGPDLGGPHAPYRQSERQSIYEKHAQTILDSDKAYFCFCPPKMIEEKRALSLKMGKPPVYDGTCARLDRAEALKRTQAGERAGLRFRAPHQTIVVPDLIRGDVEFRAGTVGDFLITRSPEPGGSWLGIPVYNFSCTIDDHLMELTHVIRGEDHLSNTARQWMLYEALGWKPPAFAHLAMVVGSDRLKLSKRTGDAASHDYLERGFIPQALLNFLVLLGWSPPAGVTPRSGHPEILAIDEMIQWFSIDRLHKSPACFDLDKLKWMNGFYIRALPLAEIARLARRYFVQDSRWKAWLDSHSENQYQALVDLFRADSSVLEELPGRAAVVLEHGLHLNVEESEILRQGLAVVKALEAESRNWKTLSFEEFKATEKKIGQETGAKGKALFQPIRVSLTGALKGPELARLVTLMSPDQLRSRIRAALEVAQEAGRQANS